MDPTPSGGRSARTAAQSTELVATSVHTADMGAAETSGAEQEPQNIRVIYRSHRPQNRSCPLHGHHVARGVVEYGWTPRYVKRLPVTGREGQVKRGGGPHTDQSVQICSKGSSAPLAPSTRTAKSCGLLAKEQGCSEPLLQIWTPTPSAPDERPPPVRPAGAVRPRQETPRIALIGARVK